MKKIVLFILAFILTAGSLSFFGVLPVAAESLYIKKIVSVVYDDSGSMVNNNSANWAYANYAMQSFAGLLNSDDRLFITYMSSSEKILNLDPPEIDLSSAGLQSSIDGICGHVEAGNTPYGAVDIAFHKLKSISDAQTTQYWLVVITDGEFQNGSSAVDKNELDAKLNGMVAEKMPNGTTPRIIYMAVGDDAIRPAEDTGRGIYVYPENGSDIISGSEIIGVISRIADKISGRSRLDDTGITLKNSDTLQITSSIPLLNIAVLSQKTSAVITGAEYADGRSLSIERSVSMSCPEMNGRATDVSLKGGAFLIGNSGSHIKAGTYSVRFSENINLENIVVMFEPALEIRMTVTRGGSELGSLASLREGDTINVGCGIYEIGTGNEISPSLLPAHTTYGVSCYENGKAVKSSADSGLVLQDISLHNRETEIVCQLQITGFNPIILSTQPFTPGKAVDYTVSVDQPDSFILTMAQLKQNTEKIRFIIKADGVPVGKSETETLDFVIKTDAPGEITYEDDGSVSFTPRYKDNTEPVPIGDVEVCGLIAGVVSAKTTFYIKPVEYIIKTILPEDSGIVRTELGSNTKAVKFEIFADGEKLDKNAVEAADVALAANKPYRKLDLETVVQDDGTIVCTPKYNGLRWLSAWTVPTGSLEITAGPLNGVSATGIFQIVKDGLHELIFNYIIPLAVLSLLYGYICKKRFKYSSRIHYNIGNGTGPVITGPRNGWNTTGLFSWTTLLPFIPDIKNVNGVKFRAYKPFWNSKYITVKPSQLPEYSGTVDGSIDEQSAVRVRHNEIDRFTGEKQKVLRYGNALVTSHNRNYNNCQIYYYSMS